MPKIIQLGSDRNSLINYDQDEEGRDPLKGILNSGAHKTPPQGEKAFSLQCSDFVR